MCPSPNKEWHEGGKKKIEPERMPVNTFNQLPFDVQKHLSQRVNQKIMVIAEIMEFFGLDS